MITLMRGGILEKVGFLMVFGWWVVYERDRSTCQCRPGGTLSLLPKAQAIMVRTVDSSDSMISLMRDGHVEKERFFMGFFYCLNHRWQGLLG